MASAAVAGSTHIVNLDIDTDDPTLREIVNGLPAREGHFLLESGHHGELWLDLEALCLQPTFVSSLAGQLAARVVGYQAHGICGPLVEGAFVALLVASSLDLEFYYTRSFDTLEREGLFPITYRVPATLRCRVRDRRVVIVNDVIGAGSAVRGTLDDLLACGARVVAMASLLVLGESASKLCAERGIPLEALGRLPNRIWKPGECPLCAAGVPLETPTSA